MVFYFRNFIFLACLLAASGFANAQSDSQNFPTPITANEITGTIPARDVGDSRLTTYYYGFEGSQGDIFLNLVTKNFNGDIDVFTAGGQQPLTKVVVYADLAESETGRVIYLRKPEKLLLRVQGRSPNDDPASFRVKFAGSFLASRDNSVAPELPKIDTATSSGIRVNSVGTIIEVLPKPSPYPKSDSGEVATADKVETEKRERTEPSETAAKTEPSEVIVPDPAPKEPAPKRRRVRNQRPRDTTKKPQKTEAAEVEAPVVKTERRRKNERKETLPDPLASIRLVILFKDGKVIERPMNEVFRFSVDKGVLTVTSKNGSIGRYPLLDVSKVTIE